jgi:hypothetical protein
MNIPQHIINQAHSGDDIKVFTNFGERFVLKKFNYQNKRLELSIKKQQEFKPIYTPFSAVSAVKIIKKYEDEEGKTNILMPYIDGLSGADYAIYGDKDTSDFLNFFFKELLIENLNKSQLTTVPKSIFHNKIKEVSNSINNKQILLLGSKIESDLIKMDNAIEIPIGFCHGDLTLSNIICSRYSGIKLIDFLTTYLESPLQDLAKIIQDYNFGWSFRYLSNEAKIKGKIFTKNNSPDVLNMVNGNYKSQIALITRLSLYRISPYIKDLETEKWLINSLNCCIETMETEK